MADGVRVDPPGASVADHLRHPLEHPRPGSHRHARICEEEDVRRPPTRGATRGRPRRTPSGGERSPRPSHSVSSLRPPASARVTAPLAGHAGQRCRSRSRRAVGRRLERADHDHAGHPVLPEEPGEVFLDDAGRDSGMRAASSGGHRPGRGDRSGRRRGSRASRRRRSGRRSPGAAPVPFSFAFGTHAKRTALRRQAGDGVEQLAPSASRAARAATGRTTPLARVPADPVGHVVVPASPLDPASVVADPAEPVDELPGARRRGRVRARSRRTSRSRSARATRRSAPAFPPSRRARSLRRGSRGGASRRRPLGRRRDEAPSPARGAAARAGRRGLPIASGSSTGMIPMRRAAGPSRLGAQRSRGRSSAALALATTSSAPTLARHRTSPRAQTGLMQAPHARSSL